MRSLGKAALGLFLALVLGVVGFYAGVILASESGEVITIQTRDASGSHATRLWVVDHDGAEWTRTGHGEKRWFQRLLADPRIELERRGVRTPRRAVPIREASIARAVNEAYAEKYGHADWIVALSGDASQRIVIRLDPIDP